MPKRVVIALTLTPPDFERTADELGRARRIGRYSSVCPIARGFDREMRRVEALLGDDREGRGDGGQGRD